MTGRFLLTLVLLGAAAQAQTTLPHYRLDVRLEPAAHTLAVAGWVKGLPCGPGQRWYLNQRFTVDTLDAGGDAAGFDTAAPAPPYVSVARPLRACGGDSVRVVYHGAVVDTIDDVNTIAPGLVELASYAGWYPFSPEAQRFTYELTVSLPAAQHLVTNGAVLTDSTVGTTRIVRVRSAGSTSDIVLLSADLAVERRRVGSLTVEAYGPRQEAGTLGRDAVALAGALATYRRWFGAVAGGGTARFVYSPRGGWGYSRLPLVVVSDGYRRTAVAQAGGEARSFEGNAHELAHFWWSLADPLTPDDWLNEGLAEYSALSGTAQRFGPVARDSLLAQYRRDAVRARTHTPIAGTPADSPDRYVNRYEKTALLLNTAAGVAGETRMRAFLKRFYAEHRVSRGATTSAFLVAARRDLGAQAAALLAQCLQAADWAPPCGGS